MGRQGSCKDRIWCQRYHAAVEPQSTDMPATTISTKLTTYIHVVRLVGLGLGSVLQCFDAVGWATRKASSMQKTLEWLVAGVVICLEWGADLHMAQMMPLPLTASCFSKIQIGFTFLVLAHPGSPGQRAVKRLLLGSELGVAKKQMEPRLGCHFR